MSIFLRTDAELAVRLDRLSAANEVALDTEFHPERSYYAKALLIQLRPDEGEVWLVDGTTIGDLRPLADRLCDLPLVVHGGATDIGIVQRLAGRAPRYVFDTQVAAGFAGLGYPRPLRDLSATLLGHFMDKGETLSDWARRPLSADQLRYAADDVLVLAPLARILRERVSTAGHATLFAECMAEKLAKWTAPPDDAAAWRRMHSAHLTVDERVALQALAEWRERTAREANVPGHSILSDAMLQDLARRRPRTLEQLRQNRRMPTGAWKAHGDAMLHVLAEAPKRSPQDPPPRGLPYDLARLAGRVAEAESGVSAELIFADCEVDYISNENSLSGWRSAALGQKWHNFIDGTLTISMPGRWT